MPRYVPVFIIALIIITSCQEPPLFEKIDAIPSEGWKAEEKLSFQFSIADTTQTYDVLFHVRNLQNYSYSNLWLFMDIAAPNTFIQRDTFEIMLADEGGRWYGKGIGNINTLLVPYQQGISFPLRGIYTITVQQGMREDILENILDLGVRVQLSEKR